ncbi:MAG TPA: GGDEF domain-containing protein [Solirubrobacteraceae bacterium]|nr:GGDEF domain-containing protein [Solirubrobacteraceae bacterium]
MAPDRQTPQEHSVPGTWLCRDDFDRERLLDMERLVTPARRRTFAILFVAIAAGAPWLGWWPVLFLVPAVGFFAAAEHFVTRVEKPELLMFAAWVGSELAIAGAVWLQGGARISAICWLAIPVITLSSRFSVRGVVAGVAVACTLVLVVAFGHSAAAAIANPELVGAPLALILSVAVLSTPLMRSEIQHRSDSVIDQLTGMLNRKALEVRVQELQMQSAVTGEPVGVIVADLDHFKAINDTHGHLTGDHVLRDVAYKLRKQLRAFDLAYRLGGEEFLVLLPGSDLAKTAQLADRLREAVSTGLAGGQEVTVSIGVGASQPREAFEYAAVFAEADAALYRAKGAGRNRVELATRPEPRLGAALPEAA